MSFPVAGGQPAKSLSPIDTRYCGVKAGMEVLGVFGATDVPGRTGLCGRSVPKGRPVLRSGVAGGKPRFSVSGGVAAPILFAGAVVMAGEVVMEWAAMAHVADNINPTAVKHIEVSFILV